MGECLALILDTETTGLGDDDEIIEIALLLFSYDTTDGRVTALNDKYTALQQPSVPCSDGALQVHGITAEITRGMSIDRARVRTLFERAQFVVAHNAEFDRRFVERMFPELHGKRWICTMRDIPWDLEGLPGKSLDSIARHYGIQRPVSHRAYIDAMTVLSVLRRRNSRGITHLKRLHERLHQQPPQLRLFDASNKIIPVVVAEIDDELLLRCDPPIVVRLWTTEGYDRIIGYLKSAGGRSDRVFTLVKNKSLELLKLFDGEQEVHLHSTEISASAINFAVKTTLREMYSRELLARFHELRKLNLALVAEARTLEKVNRSEAVRIYRKALANIEGYANIQPLIGIAGQLRDQERIDNGIDGHLEILDRLTLCLCRLSCGEEAFSIAAGYFSKFKADRQKPLAARILKRVSKFE